MPPERESRRVEQIVRSMPVRLLQEYLQELGGRLEAPGCVVGQGWAARYERIEDYQLGSLRVGQVRLILEGEPAVLEHLLPALERKMMRAGA